MISNLTVDIYYHVSAQYGLSLMLIIPWLIKTIRNGEILIPTPIESINIMPRNHIINFG